jgi:L-rhamnose mutarotase
MSTNLFRRFTYFLIADNSNLSEVITSDSFEQLKQTEGVVELNAYQKENKYFMVIDAAPSFNAERLFDTLQTSESFKDFQAVFPNSDTALERIYKLDQKEVYTATEGQLKTYIKPYKRFVWTLLLEPSLIDEYKRVHSIGMAWPEITANMKTIGVKDMEIYIHNEQVMLIMDTIPDFDLKAIGPEWQKLPREEEWQKYVAKFQKTDPESSIQEKWQDMLPL